MKKLGLLLALGFIGFGLTGCSAGAQEESFEEVNMKNTLVEHFEYAIAEEGYEIQRIDIEYTEEEIDYYTMEVDNYISRNVEDDINYLVSALSELGYFITELNLTEVIEVD